MRNEEKVRAFQDRLIEKGWLSRAELDIMGEYGSLGDLTYAAVWEVQQYAADPLMASVRDEAGFYRSGYGTGDYYPIDERTYRYIMEQLAQKP